MRIIRRNTLIVGTGAAGLNAADRLWSFGQKDLAVVTEGVHTGTSRNTGSDKQTYYKLTLAGGEGDSVQELAQSLFDGQAMDGDLALCEAAMSTRCFMHLVELGVPFPRNRYGEYAGYRTDHDPRRRATSVGPYTSRCMTEALERSVREKGIEILDRLQVIRVLSDGSRVFGLLCLDLDHQEDPEKRFVGCCCTNIVYAVGGPAGMYANSVYPHLHYGGTGAALRAGAEGRNLTEWQYGLASVQPRWNVSGTYMQALPRFVSTDPNGGDAREFLGDTLTDPGDMLSRVFLKGYQWPFDVRKAGSGSSVIDLLVFLEQEKGRRVFLDFRRNPGGGALEADRLSPEAREYLERAGACGGTPLERLRRMNAPAVDFYREHGVDLSRQMLEIALCAQHNNGGLAVDRWWRTSLEGLYAAGEAAGTHGVYRPGGSALNAGQVGSLRAAEHIAAFGRNAPDERKFEDLLKNAAAEAEAIAGSALNGGADTLKACWTDMRRQMSRAAGPIRDRAAIQAQLERVMHLRSHFSENVHVSVPEDLGLLFRLEDMLVCQQVYLSAMLDYIGRGGKSRGSALYTDTAGEKPAGNFPDTLRFQLDRGELAGMIQEARLDGSECRFRWREVHPIPREDDFFENVWRAFRETGNMD